METFAPPKRFVENAEYSRARAVALAKLDLRSIDEPIVDLIAGFATLPHCFTLQSCHGHFVCSPGQAPDNHDPIPGGHVGAVKYRIAYVAFCLENSERGRTLWKALSQVPNVDPSYVQFGSPGWFWERWVNSYALQVEPIAYQYQDEATLEADEAFHTQGTRDRFFNELRELLASEASLQSAGQ